MPRSRSGYEVFVSYAHTDESLRKKLDDHLSSLKKEGLIRVWNDRVITAGDEWHGEIHANLESARLILLLVSPPFMASSYCWDVEVKRAMERHEAGQARVVPIILRPVDWHRAPFGKLQALPRDGKPVVEWRPRDAGFLDVAKGLRAAIELERKRDAAGSEGEAAADRTPASPAVARGSGDTAAGRSAASLLPAREEDDAEPLRRLTCNEMRARGYLAALAETFDTEAAAHTLLDRAGIPRSRIPPFGRFSPIDFWEEVCRELDRGLVVEGPAALLGPAAERYPNNPAFRRR